LDDLVLLVAKCLSDTTHFVILAELAIKTDVTSVREPVGRPWGEGSGEDDGADGAEGGGLGVCRPEVDMSSAGAYTRPLLSST
jgi:hypothetical protein